MYVTTSYRKTNPLMTLIANDINKSLMLPTKSQNWRREFVSCDIHQKSVNKHTLDLLTD